MVTLFKTYPYLGLSFELLVILLAVLVMFKGQWKPALLSGLLSVPYAFTSIFFVPEYWDPTRVAVFVAGPEDIIFSFANGSMVWLMAVWPIRKRGILRIQTGRLIMRYAACSSSGVAFSLILQSFGIGVMTATLVTITAFGVLLICNRCALWPVSAVGAIGFTTIYTIFFCVILTINPCFVEQWNIENLWGISLLGIPVEELVWAITFGASWPLFMAYVFDVSLISPDKDCEEKESRFLSYLYWRLWRRP